MALAVFAVAWGALFGFGFVTCRRLGVTAPAELGAVPTILSFVVLQVLGLEGLVCAYVFLVLGSATMLSVAEMVLSEPRDFQVVQRTSRNEGTLPIRGRIEGAGNGTFEARLVSENEPGAWQKLVVQMEGDEFHATFGRPGRRLAIACGIGATSVREWLPKGSVFPNPPTLEGWVRKLPSGDWESKGGAYSNLVVCMKQTGHFRAGLWHQGESDANQEDPNRTLPGGLYRQYLERVIRGMRLLVMKAYNEMFSFVSILAWFFPESSFVRSPHHGGPDAQSAGSQFVQHVQLFRYRLVHQLAAKGTFAFNDLLQIKSHFRP